MTKVGTDHRRALERLAESTGGCTEDVLQMLGFSADLIAELIRGGLASAQEMRTLGERRLFKVRRIQITETGRQELAKPLDT